MEPKKDSQTTPTETPDLDRMINDSLPEYSPDMDPGAFPGSPAEPPNPEPSPPTPPPKPAEPPPEPTPAPEPTPPPAAAPDTPPPAQPGDDAGATGTKPPEAKQYPPWYRFNGNYDKSEEGYRNLRGQITKVEQKNADLVKELDELKKREALERRQEEERTALFEFAKNRRKQLQEEKNKLDPDADDYDDRLATIETQAEMDIRNFKYEPPPADPGAQAAVTEGTPPPAQPGDDAGATEPPPPKTDVDLTFEEQEAIQSEINTILPEFGLEPDDPVFAGYYGRADKRMDLTDQVSWALGMTRDYMAREMAAAEKINPADPVLISYINQEPVRDNATGKMIPIATQIAHALDKTKKYKAAQRDKTLQETGAPIRRTATPGPTPPKPQDVKPMSLGDALDKSEEKMVIS